MMMRIAVVKRSSLLIVSASVSLLLLLVVCCAHCATPEVELDAPNERAALVLPKLFDFGAYKQLFGKRYTSWLEELNRKRLHLSRALRAYVSGIKFKFWQREHYNAVNHLSDKSPEELALMRNRLLEEQQQQQQQEEPNLEQEVTQKAPEVEDKLPELITVDNDGEDVEAELVELIRKDPAFEDLRKELGSQTGSRRRKREATSQRSPRDLPMDRLINTGLAVGAQRHVTYKPQSNNPHYKPIEVASYGLVDQQERVKWFQLARKDRRPVGEQLSESLAASTKTSGRGSCAVAGSCTLPDEVYVDHNQSGCLLEPKQQNECGCCYAFATMALMEFHLCQKTGKLTPLSEQYMIDCGRGRFGRTLNGCHGGLALGTADFVHNFGLELARNYPYTGSEGVCPYADDYDLKQTGYLRLELNEATAIAQADWPAYLAKAPLYVQAKTGEEFAEYGGGVDMGANCAQSTNHAMVLVGHGRQDGRDYWLLRNSFSTKWGERGHWKLAKSASVACLGPLAYAYGTRDGLNYKAEPKQVGR